jgi:hypothetical protein
MLQMDPFASIITKAQRLTLTPKKYSVELCNSSGLLSKYRCILTEFEIKNAVNLV